MEQNTSPKSIASMASDEMDIEHLPDTFAKYKMLVSEKLEKKYQDLIKTYQTISQQPEFVTLLNTEPSASDRVKRFETTYEKAGLLLESFASAVELVGSALLPEAALKMKYRAMISHKSNKGLHDKLQSDEAKIQRNVQILYDQAKEIAVRYQIPVEIIDKFLANEDYVAMDKLIMKDKKCKHGLRYNSMTGQIKCIRKREVMRAQKEPKHLGQAKQPSCYQRRKDDCVNTPHCTWEVGKRCKSIVKMEKDKGKEKNGKPAFTNYENPMYNAKSSSPFANYQVVSNPLFTRVRSK